METNPLPFNSDLENASSPYTPLLGNDILLENLASRRRSVNFHALISSLALLLVFVLLLIGIQRHGTPEVNNDTASSSSSTSRGVSEGVSEKTFRLSSGNEIPFEWTNSMLSWQRTAYHFQPKSSWMNDPNGPLFYKGWYHLFYQYNPDSAVWGLIRWGHAISEDLIHWRHLPLAMVPDQWYDINGVWTGSATILPNGTIIMLYTGSTNESVQVQNLAYPVESDDEPYLINWVKYPGNPVLVPPPGIGTKDFRDPTTAWQSSDGSWKITIGSKVNTTGISLVYKTKDFKTYDLLDDVLHAVPGTGMWECVDFYPVSTTEDKGLSTSSVKHVLKASLDDDKNDYYALGTYDPESDTWIPDNPILDVGIGLRYDYGKYYASKTFYDQKKERRILWGWISESDSEVADVKKGWASVQGVPRTVLFDKKTRTNILQWPVEEVEKLRSNAKTFNNITVKAGSMVPLDIGRATQLDITAEFEIDIAALGETIEDNLEYKCSTSGGASGRGRMGPFGLLVLAHGSLSEHTPVYFYLAEDRYGNIKTFFCTDQSRSSKANDVSKVVYGSTVPVLAGEKLSMRILVDHSIVESFAQGGRTCITSRVYPTEAINENAKVFVFNNATQASVTASITTWQMSSAVIRSYSMLCVVLAILIHLVFLKI